MRVLMSMLASCTVTPDALSGMHFALCGYLFYGLFLPDAAVFSHMYNYMVRVHWLLARFMHPCGAPFAPHSVSLWCTLFTTQLVCNLCGFRIPWRCHPSVSFSVAWRRHSGTLGYVWSIGLWGRVNVFIARCALNLCTTDLGETVHVLPSSPVTSLTALHVSTLLCYSLCLHNIALMHARSPCWTTMTRASA